MKLRITGGFLEVEVVEGSGDIDDVKLLLKKLAVTPDEEVIANIRNAGKPKVSVYSSKSGMRGKLNAKARMPI